MQNDFIDGPLGNDECKQAVPAVIDAVNNGGYTDVILTRDTHGDNYLNTQEEESFRLSTVLREQTAGRLTAIL